MISAIIVVGSTLVSIWEPDLTIGQLASKLSSGATRYTAEATIQGRHVAVFAKNRPGSEIARMVANCMGFKLRGTTFVADPAYERMTEQYESSLKAIAIDGLKKAVRELRATPPSPKDVGRFVPRERIRPLLQRTNTQSELHQDAVDRIAAMLKRKHEVTLLLSRLSDANLKELLAGNFVVGSVPHRGNTVALPGQPRDYRAFPQSNQGYVAIRFESETSQLAWGTYSPGEVAPNRRYDSVRLTGAGLYGWPSDPTPLGVWVRTWASRRDNVNQAQNLAKIPAGKVGHGEMLAELARVAKVPLVAERMPWIDNGPHPSWDKATVFNGAQDGWLLIKPAQFWQSRQMWATASRLRQLSEPSTTDAILAVNWAADLSAQLPGDYNQYMFHTPGAASNREGFGYQPELAAFWTSLTQAEKGTILKTGLSRSVLAAKSRDLLDSAAFQSILRYDQPKGDVSAWFERSPANKVRLRTKRSWWYRDSNGGFGATTLRDMEDTARQNPRPGHRKFTCLEFTFTFVSPKGSSVAAGKVFRKIE